LELLNQHVITGCALAVGQFERALVFTLLKQAQRLIDDRRAALAAAAGQIAFQKAPDGRVDRDRVFCASSMQILPWQSLRGKNCALRSPKK
jgi:hypothetical protein